eukprot:Rmarinus@m.14697
MNPQYDYTGGSPSAPSGDPQWNEARGPIPFQFTAQQGTTQNRESNSQSSPASRLLDAKTLLDESLINEEEFLEVKAMLLPQVFHFRPVDTVSYMRELKALVDHGLLAPDEFQAEKMRIIYQLKTGEGHKARTYGIAANPEGSDFSAAPTMANLIAAMQQLANPSGAQPQYNHPPTPPSTIDPSDPQAMINAFLGLPQARSFANPFLQTPVPQQHPNISQHPALPPFYQQTTPADSSHAAAMSSQNTPSFPAQHVPHTARSPSPHPQQAPHQAPTWTATGSCSSSSPGHASCVEAPQQPFATTAAVPPLRPATPPTVPSTVGMPNAGPTSASGPSVPACGSESVAGSGGTLSSTGGTGGDTGDTGNSQYAMYQSSYPLIVEDPTATWYPSMPSEGYAVGSENPRHVNARADPSTAAPQYPAPNSIVTAAIDHGDLDGSPVSHNQNVAPSRTAPQTQTQTQAQTQAQGDGNLSSLRRLLDGDPQPSTHHGQSTTTSPITTREVRSASTSSCSDVAIVHHPKTTTTANGMASGAAPEDQGAKRMVAPVGRVMKAARDLSAVPSEPSDLYHREACYRSDSDGWDAVDDLSDAGDTEAWKEMEASGIQVNIPKARDVPKEGKLLQYTQVFVVVSCEGECCWDVTRKYSEFKDLESDFKKVCTPLSKLLPHLPSKFGARGTEGALLEKTKMKLENFLSQAATHIRLLKHFGNGESGTSFAVNRLGISSAIATELNSKLDSFLGKPDFSASSAKPLKRRE